MSFAAAKVQFFFQTTSFFFIFFTLLKNVFIRFVIPRKMFTFVPSRDKQLKTNLKI